MRYQLKTFQNSRLIKLGSVDSLKEGLEIMKTNRGVLLFDSKEKKHLVYDKGKIHVLEHLLADLKKKRRAKEIEKRKEEQKGSVQDEINKFRKKVADFQQGVRDAQKGLREGLQGEGELSKITDRIFRGRRRR